MPTEWGWVLGGEQQQVRPGPVARSELGQALRCGNVVRGVICFQGVSLQAGLVLTAVGRVEGKSRGEGTGQGFCMQKSQVRGCRGGTCTEMGGMQGRRAHRAGLCKNTTDAPDGFLCFST